MGQQATDLNYLKELKRLNKNLEKIAEELHEMNSKQNYISVPYVQPYDLDPITNPPYRFTEETS